MFDTSISMLTEKLDGARKAASAAEREWGDHRRQAEDWKATYERHIAVVTDLVSAIDLLRVNQGLVDHAGHGAPAQNDRKGE